MHSFALRLAAALLLGGSSLPAQLVAGAQAVALVTRVQPGFRGSALTEGYLTQPMIMAHGTGFGNRLRATVTLDFEGATLKRGELNPGVYGESYMDRRHPHTLLHEGMLTAGMTHASLSLGKGFVPFGTDDPMVRPFVKYPVNHHLAQILERAVIVAAGRWRAVLGEAALFNGDEPDDPYDWPNLDHVGDSWAMRATVAPRLGIEVQGSLANVTSPENSFGSGLDQRKLSASFRFERDDRRYAPYVLAEWARTDDLLGGRRVFRFGSVLAEAGANAGAVRVAARLEQTTRPEEERLLDIFRTPRPLHDNSIIGQTRWRIASISAGRRVRVSRMELAPFVEASVAAMAPSIRPVAFDPAIEVFGASRVWSLSAGIRWSAGTLHGRMGRYGVADVPGSAHTHTHQSR